MRKTLKLSASFLNEMASKETELNYWKTANYEYWKQSGDRKAN
jgi:hypothetical protein